MRIAPYCSIVEESTGKQTSRPVQKIYCPDIKHSTFNINGKRSVFCVNTSNIFQPQQQISPHDCLKHEKQCRSVLQFSLLVHSTSYIQYFVTYVSLISSGS